jgi:hypothetical protein
MTTYLPAKMTPSEADAFLAQFSDADLEAMTVSPEEEARLTDDDVNRIVSAVRESRPVGRPSLSNHGSESPRINVRLSESDNRNLLDAARLRGVKTTELAREFIRDGLARQRQSDLMPA